MNNEQLNQILQELYAIDPAFRQHEVKLIKIISELMVNKPDAKIDPQFVEILRQQLMAKATLMQQEPARKTFWLFRLQYAIGGLAVIAIAIISGVYWQKHGQERSFTAQKFFDNSNQELLASSVQVNKVAANAFGKLSAMEMAPAGMGGNGNEGRGAAEPQNTLSAPAAAPNDSSASSYAADAPMAAPKAMSAPSGFGSNAKIMPPFYNFKYVYKGGDIDLSQDQVMVYRRIKGMGTNMSAGQLLKQLNFGLIDMSKFGNAKVQSMNIVEDKDFGYNFYISLEEGTINISENWTKWPTPEIACKGDQQCYENSRIKIGDVPSDDELISITNQFLKDHNISRASYGEPSVENSWRREYANFQDKSQFYIPSILTVIYPLKIDGQEVVDQGGNRTGLSVSVDLHFKKVSGIAELVNLKYDASEYSAITDQKTIVDYAEKGGSSYPIYYAEGGQTSTLELGQPTKTYVKLWKNDDKNQTQELLVPALVFPILNKPEAGYYQKNVVVPLVKEMLEQDNGGGPIRIMPAMPMQTEPAKPLK